MSNLTKTRLLAVSSAMLAVLLAPEVHAAPAASCLVGEYDGHQMEIGAGLELAADGRFKYGLAYGALDEQAEGRWETGTAGIYLTSDPVTPPRFSLASETPGTNGEFRVFLDLPGGMEKQYFAFVLTLASGQVVEQQFADQGVLVELKPDDRVVSAVLRLTVYDLTSAPIPLSTGNGHDVHFRFEPNDLGKVAFAQTPLRRDGADLLIERYDRELRFRPVKGGCRR